jgi:hypothetical protein
MAVPMIFSEDGQRLASGKTFWQGVFFIIVFQDKNC